VAPSDGWVVTLRAEGDSHGELVVEFDRAATEVLTKRIMGMEIEPPGEVVVDTLKEICAQAAGSMVLEPPLVGTKLAVASVTPVTDAAPQAPVLAEIRVGDIATLPLRFWGDIAFAVGPRPVQAPAAPASANPRLDVILDIDLPLTVRFGRAEMPLRVITSMGPGSMIDLGRSPDDPVEVLVSNQVVARGEVVIVGGNYGVRITNVISPADRVRTMESEF
jgi:flagellar motor switch protein FliN/FliY